MQTMTALMRVAGSREMTVQLQRVTPAEAWLLMHVHDPVTKDVFEGAEQTLDIDRTRLDERARLLDKYPQHAGLVNHLFPGRTAGDVPERFDELEDTPLELAQSGQETKHVKRAKAGVEDAEDDGEFVEVTPAASPAQPMDEDALREQVGGTRRKK